MYVFVTHRVLSRTLGELQANQRSANLSFHNLGPQNLPESLACFDQPNVWSGNPTTDELAGFIVIEGPLRSFGIRRYAQEREQSKPQAPRN